LLANVEAAIASGALPPSCEAHAGTLAGLPAQRSFDSILYIDVLEHIEDDRVEARHAAGRLRSGGKLIVLAPAHQWLYSPFDEAIGHFRRYSRSSLAAAVPSELKLVELRYLDCVGLLASKAHRASAKSSFGITR
jgi:2-polyprenyl-3-methyl-5-hydroxy-6-metoxy-1,4-benzoquinol methylase